MWGEKALRGIGSAFHQQEQIKVLIQQAQRIASDFSLAVLPALPAVLAPSEPRSVLCNGSACHFPGGYNRKLSPPS